MISAEQNDFITRVGPGAPAGKLLRRYWQPVALVDELEGERPVRAVRLMGKTLCCSVTRPVNSVCWTGTAHIAALICLLAV
jgi:hypothetical protein